MIYLSKLDEKIYLMRLYDFYSSLLTDKQKYYFEQYYFSDLSLQEISENVGVSRNAVHDQLKKIVLKLETYEEKLDLYKKDIRLREVISRLKQLDNDEVIKIISELEGD